MHHLTAVAIKWSCILAINCCYGQLPMAEFITKMMYFYKAVNAVLRYLLPVGYSLWPLVVAARRSARRAASRLVLLLETPAAPFFGYPRFRPCPSALLSVAKTRPP